MKQVFRIDDQGFFVEPVMIAEDEELPGDCVDEMPPYGLYKPKYFGGQWVEGATPEEIEAIKNPSLPKSDIEILKEENEALKERIELMQAALDDLILGGM